MRTFKQLAISIVLLLLACPAWALGLGQIQVKSQPGQPLLAEIPIVSSNPEELRGLQARLASPEVFRRIGLQAPSGVVENLQFSLAVSDSGQPYIRVSTSQPVQQPALTFLVEVDWGQGRLVREYTALVDGPRTIEALPPVVQAPQTSLPPTVQVPQTPSRPTAPVAAVEPSVADTATDPNATAAADTETNAQPSAAQSTPPLPRPAPVFAQPPMMNVGAQEIHVQRGQNLSQIASAHRADLSLNQMMMALMQANPEAFINQDINRLRTGAVLRVPSRDAVAALPAAEADRFIRAQMAQRRRSGRSTAIAANDAERAPASATQTRRNAAASSAQVADARLEIAATGENRNAAAGNQSGLSATGEGDMLRQELQETLAARESEVAELKARVAELEQLSSDQQRLIEMKDNALAQAQQQVGQNQQTANAINMWLWALPVALLLALAVWLLSRRGKKTNQVDARRKPYLAGAPLPLAQSDATDITDDAPLMMVDINAEKEESSLPIAEDAAPVTHSAFAALDTEADLKDGVTDAGAENTQLAQMAGQDDTETPDGVMDQDADAEKDPQTARVSEKLRNREFNSTPPAQSTGTGVLNPEVIAASTLAGSSPYAAAAHAGAGAGETQDAVQQDERIALAQAYLDLGDEITARSVLSTVANSDAGEVSERARQMLADLDRSS